MRVIGARRYEKRRSRGAVLLWALLASAGMILMTGMTFEAMLLQLTEWRTEREHVVVRHAARALLVRCEKLRLGALLGHRDRDESGCDGGAAWRPLHDLMRKTPRPEQWRRHLALSPGAKGTRQLAWTMTPAITGRFMPRHAPQWVVDAVCLPETWIDEPAIGRVEVLTVRAQIRRTEKGDPFSYHAEEGLWLQSIVARRPAPCLQTVRTLREIVEPGRRGVNAR